MGRSFQVPLPPAKLATFLLYPDPPLSGGDEFRWGLVLDDHQRLDVFLHVSLDVLPQCFVHVVEHTRRLRETLLS